MDTTPSRSPATVSAGSRSSLKRRKPHRKSRTGCVDCRRRRVKCDEERPACRACSRRDIDCQYSIEAQATVTLNHHAANDEQEDQRSPCGSASASNHTVPLGPPAPRSASVETPATVSTSLSDAVEVFPTSSESFSLNDLGLLHHWTVCTSVDIFRAPDTNDIWQTFFPQIGLQYPFVIHAILGLAALHVGHIDGSKRTASITEATNHHNQALYGFQNAINCVSQENSEALLTWSLLNVLYVFAISNPLHNIQYDASPHSRTDRLLGVEWIPMMRGIDAVLQPTHNYLHFGRFSMIMSVGNWFELDPKQECSDSEDGHFCRTREAWKSSNDGDTYDEVLHMLRKCRLYSRQFRSMDAKDLEQWGYNRSWSAPLMFIHFAPESYFTLLHQRQPPALVLFAFFGALLHGINDYWFLEGWGKAIVEVIRDLLGSYWKPWISWPLQIVGTSTTE
ncbi:hypothetical protein EDB80DRAFT_763969 [Ilyonectria destructans]|nr:hypothetical protein EDB80DRAFT_763969 [Ilyonectria destructans]